MSHSAQSLPRFNTLATTISSVLGTGGFIGTTFTSAPAVAQDAAVDEIMVTGSRIVRRDFVAASPIVTVDAAELEHSSTLSVESVLNQLPHFQPAGTQFVSGGQGSPTTSLGIASANLRGIGTNRTLVLVDGRRPQPANAALIVDINTIPAGAIQRVETITGGASAVYGPDALAGVVNFVLKRDFEGVEMDFTTSLTGEGDGAENRFTTLIGMNSADGRGNIMLGAEWYDREVVWQRDRKFFRDGWFDPQTNQGGFILAPGFSFAGPASRRPTQQAVDEVFAVHGFAPGSINVVPGTPGVVNEIYFNPDGTPFVISGGRGYTGPLGQEHLGGGYAGIRFNRNGNLGQPFMFGMASTPQERRSVFGRATYDIGNDLSVFSQVTYSNNVVTTTGGIPPAITVWQAFIPRDDRAIPSALQTLLESRPDQDGDWVLFRGIDYYNEPFTTDNRNDVHQLMFGLEGRFPNSDWTWEAYVSTGQTDTRNDYRFLPSLQRYRMLMAQPNWGDGEVTIEREYKLHCPGGMPVFGGPNANDNIHPRCLETMDLRGRGSSRLTQDIVEFNLQGRVADMPAGEMRFAAGASWRDNRFRFDPLNNDTDVTDHPIGIFVSNNTRGRTDVTEVYGELLVPVVDRLDLELGYRFSDFSTEADSVHTWKALFDYAATNSVRLRGGLQSATRAPNTSELFQGPTMLTVTFAGSDPCSFTTTHPWGNVAGNPRRLEVQQLCIDIIGHPNTPFGGTPGSDAANNFARPGLPFFQAENVYEMGNPELQAETADTWTLGVVLAGPGRLQNLTAAIDLYSIEITDAIFRMDPVFVYAQCFNADGVSNPTLTIDDPGGYCRMIDRHQITGERNIVDAPFVNQGTFETTGLDLALNWAFNFGNGGSFYVNSHASVLNKFKLQDAPGEPFIDYRDTLGQGGQFRYRLNTTFGYNLAGGTANVGVRWYHLPSVRHGDAARNPATTTQGTGSYDRFGLFGTYHINDRYTLRGGIDNVLDKRPPIIGSEPNNRNASSTNTQFYDILGRRAYIALKMEF